MRKKVEALKQDANRARFSGRRCWIWSDEHKAYWRSDAAGYTENREEAGTYDFDDAWVHVETCGPKKKLSLEFIGKGYCWKCAEQFPMDELVEDDDPYLKDGPSDRDKNYQCRPCAKQDEDDAVVCPVDDPSCEGGDDQSHEACQPPA